MSVVGYVDLLGFSQQVENNLESAKNVLNDFYEIAYSLGSDLPSLELIIVSDSLICWSENEAHLIDFLCELFRNCFTKNKDYNINSGKILLPRGAVVLGEVADAVGLEKSIKGSRLLISFTQKDIPSIYWNIDINTVLYKDETIVSKDGNIYCDALWFRGINPLDELVKEEMLSLVNLAEELVERYSNNPSVLEYYIETLRIGLLSYAKFLELTDRIFIEQLFCRFDEDKYWRIWLTIFEIALQSGDSFMLSRHEVFIGFIKRKMISKGWVQLIQYLHKKENIRLYQHFKKFVKSLRITTTNGNV